MGIGDKIVWAFIRAPLIIVLVWLRLIEAYIPIWGALVVWAVVTVVIFRWPESRQEEQPPEAAVQAAVQ